MPLHHQHLVGRGRRDLSLRLAWTTEWFPGHPGYRENPCSEKAKTKKEVMYTAVQDVITLSETPLFRALKK